MIRIDAQYVLVGGTEERYFPVRGFDQVEAKQEASS